MHAFDVGADQYITKPFALPELLNRIKNLLERYRTLLTDSGSSKSLEETVAAAAAAYVFGNVRVDFQAFEVFVEGKKYSLTTLEMQLLGYFIEHEGEVLSRHKILEEVWDQSSDVTTRTIDNFVLRLRKILEPDPARPKYILSVRGTGYRFLGNQIPHSG
jgi:DNA-binding response OmpR family regulator